MVTTLLENADLKSIVVDEKDFHWTEWIEKQARDLGGCRTDIRRQGRRRAMPDGTASAGSLRADGDTGSL